MFHRELGVTRLVDLDDECHSALGAAKGEGLADVLVGDGVQVLEVVIGTALDHAATKLGLLIRVVEIDEGECDSRIASSVLRFEGGFPRYRSGCGPLPGLATRVRSAGRRPA